MLTFSNYEYISYNNLNEINENYLNNGLILLNWCH